jgi:hypothetical protein
MELGPAQMEEVKIAAFGCQEYGRASDAGALGVKFLHQ